MHTQIFRRLLVPAAVATILLAGGHALRAQAPRIRYLSGQNIQPVFEGWQKKSDGTFDLVFSYLNRNLAEDFIVPIGKENMFEPGVPDRGQPSYFYSGRRQFVFRINVPKDFGAKELTWSLTVKGETLKAVGSLMPVWEIDTRLIVSRTVAAARLDTLDKNKFPVVVLDPISAVTLPATATLKAVVTDDGVPGPRPPRPERQGGANEPIFMNAPLPPLPPAPPPGLSLQWIEYRGPAKVTFEPADPVAVKSGEKSTATVRFTAPGTYELRAVASDSILETTQNVTVTVTGSR